MSSQDFVKSLVGILLILFSRGKDISKLVSIIQEKLIILRNCLFLQFKLYFIIFYLKLIFYIFGSF